MPITIQKWLFYAFRSSYGMFKISWTSLFCLYIIEKRKIFSRENFLYRGKRQNLFFQTSVTEWSIIFFTKEVDMFFIICRYKKLGITVTVTICPDSSIIWVISRSFNPTTFCPLTSRRLWSMRRPFRAAEESTTIREDQF